MKTYSVVIPCYNCSTSIVRAIESVSKQTIKPQQIICVDNNSKDNTFEILNQIKEQLPGIIVVQEFNQGASFARNKGVTYVTSDYVQFLDADDLLLENKVKQQLELLQDIEYTELPLIVEGADVSLKQIAILKLFWKHIVHGVKIVFIDLMVCGVSSFGMLKLNSSLSATIDLV